MWDKRIWSQTEMIISTILDLGDEEKAFILGERDINY
jgi:hypothetical protein